MTENSQVKYTFIFKTHEIRELKQAISALCDPQFNPKGVGRIDVHVKWLKFTVWNAESRVLGDITLSPVQGGIFYIDQEFVWDEGFSPGMVDLDRVLRYLMLVDDDDIVGISHVVESEEICFTFGKNSSKEFSVELLALNASIRELPVINLLYGFSIPSGHLREMIPFMSDEKKLQNVSVTMIEESVGITIGEKQWLLHKVDMRKGRKRWKIYEEYTTRCFQWPHSELLMYSSYLSNEFLLYSIDDLPDSILFGFPITKTLSLSFIKHHGTSAEQTSSENLKFEQKPIYSFSFHVCPITPLKKALQFLSNPTLCKPPGLGLIRVNDRCCQIIVRNADTGAFGLVQLLATGVINYRFKKDLKGNMVDVRKMARNLSRSANTDFVGVGQADGSNELSFKTAWTGAFAVEVLEMDGEFEEWPQDISIAYEARIPSKYVKEMVPLLMRNNRPQSVTMEIEHGFSSLSINGKSWQCEYNEQLLEQKHRVVFEWPHPETLSQASDLADWFSICFLTHPPRSIMLRIKLENIGYLAYINQVHVTIAPSEGHDIPN